MNSAEVNKHINKQLRRKIRKKLNLNNIKNKLGWNKVVISLMKQPTFCDATTGYSMNWHLRNVRRNVKLMTCQSLSAVKCFWLVKKYASSNLKHCPDMGSDTPPGWNFYARSSDVKFPRLGCDLSLHIKRMFKNHTKKQPKTKPG